MAYIPFLKKVKTSIDRAKIVSFDIFDTLFLRPYLEPTDLFYHLEYLENVPDFALSRIKAEQAARRTHHNREDIVFDAIYDHIDKEFLSFKEKELALEIQVLRANLEMLQVYQYALAEGKRIVIASDIYLPTDFLAKVLQKNGISEYAKLYVSGNHGKTKEHGSLYQHIQEDLKVAVKDILHIGDDRKSDYRGAKKQGIGAILYKQVTKQYIEADRRAKIFHKQTKGDLGASILLSLMAWRWQKKQMGSLVSNYWEDLGYEYAGPVCYSYARWIEGEAKKSNLDNLLFIARDGYTLQKVFKTFDTSIETHYVYAPRFLSSIYRSDYSPKDEDRCLAIINYFSDKNEELARLSANRKFDYKSAYSFIAKHLKLFQKLVSVELENYRKHLMGAVGMRNKIGIVDTSTEQFSSQKLLQYVLGAQATIYGLYWVVLSKKWERLSHSSFIQEGANKLREGNVFEAVYNWMEFMVSSPEYPVRGVNSDGKPIYNPTPSQYEKVCKKLYPDISASAVMFAEEVKELFGRDLFLSAPVITKYMSCFVEYPRRIDIESFSVVRHSTDSEHKKYVPLFSIKIPFKETWRHPWTSLRLIKMARWRTWMQNLMVCLFFPIKISMRGSGPLEVYLFPLLHRRYLVISVDLLQRVYCRFIIGSKIKKLR